MPTDVTLESGFSLTEASFDITGLVLPTGLSARNIYYEPGATQGTAGEMFRHREGPRQTFGNRIQTGLSGGSVNQPLLFVKSGSALPITLSLHPNWIQTLRANVQNRYVLDDRVTSLITWLFRFGIPKVGQVTASIGVHIGSALLEPRPELALLPIPNTLSEVRAELEAFLGLQAEELAQLAPQLGNADPSIWASSEPIAFSALQNRLLQAFASAPLALQTDTGTSSQETPEPSVVPSGFNWDALLTDLLADASLIGVEDVFIQTIAALRAGKYVILLGAPGTGKTEVATAICRAATELGTPGFTIVTATAEWTTFETIGGYMPNNDGSGTLSFVQNTVTDTMRTGKWLVIDELNRADIDKAFGELFTVFTGNKVRLAYRQNDQPIVLIPPGQTANEGEMGILLDPNWRMIGTMNTFDKASLFQLSFAFMRRFAFVEIPVLGQENFSLLLTQAVESYLPTSTFGVPVVSETQDALLDLFAAPNGQGLDALSLRVGPAIPLDIIKYLSERYQIANSRNCAIEPLDSILHALEMYLFPQFEGRDTQHVAILEALQVVLKMTPAQQRSTARVLAAWTGYVAQEG